MAVDRRIKGEGFVKQVIQYVDDYTKKNGLEKLKLSTRLWNDRNRNVCKDLGFTGEAYLRKEYLNEDLIQYSYFPRYG